MRLWIVTHCLVLSALLMGCQSVGFGGEIGEGSSEPTNHSEEVAYKRALLKCYKTGGQRVVKIQGQLLCY